jgi:hypothetical protein
MLDFVAIDVSRPSLSAMNDDEVVPVQLSQGKRGA